jgi:tetratricopeptide (TPR) repeat protein
VAEEYFEKTPHKSNRWFRAFIVFALLYGITYSLYALFNWMFFLAAAFSLFMSYFAQPVQPKIFQKQARPSNSGGRTSYTPPPSSGSPMQPDRIKKIGRIIVISIVSFFAFLMLVGIFSGNNDDETTTTSTNEEEQSDSNDSGDSNEAQALTFKGNDLINDSQTDSAEVYYDRALGIDPDFMMAVYGKGLVSYYRGNRDEATTYFERAYEGGYRYAWLSWVLGDTYEKSGSTERAIDLYKESINLDSTFTDSYNRLAELVPDERDKYLDLSQKHPGN